MSLERGGDGARRTRDGGTLQRLQKFFESTIVDIVRQFRWSFLPPLMVYFAAGVSGLTSVVGTFFIKDYLNLSAAFIAGLGFWTGIPWALKMPLGHIVDLFWRWKSLLVFLGAGLIAASLLIMYGLIAHTAAMTAIAPAETWFVVSTLMSPVGYVIQDVVADAMTVEAVPVLDEGGKAIPAAEAKAMHTTMQTLGRFAIISGLIIVAALNIFMFAGAEKLPPEALSQLYANVYLAALVIPLVSVAGVVLAEILKRTSPSGVSGPDPDLGMVSPNWWILGGSLAFAAFTILVGTADIPFAQEIVFAGSLAIVIFLIWLLTRELSQEQVFALAGTALIIFAFRATPLPGPGQTWFEIDVLGFDQQFLAILSLITSFLALAGLILLRPMIATWSIAKIVAVLTLAGGVLALPNIGLYYGVQEWTSALTGGVVDARFIAILDTAVESPLGQVAMVPMLAWIAQNSPAHLKATFFAVMASFTNLALAASSLFTRYLNEVFVVTREVKDPASGAVTVAANYSELGVLLIVVTLVSVALPLLAIAAVQASKLKTTQ